MSETNHNTDPFEGYQPDDAVGSSGISNFDSDVEFDHSQFDQDDSQDGGSGSDDSVADGSLVQADPTSSDPQDTLLSCFGWLARGYGLEANVTELLNEYTFAGLSPSDSEVGEIAGLLGLKSNQKISSWDQLDEAGLPLPAIARLNNGNFVIFVDRPSQSEDSAAQVTVFDPLAGTKDFIRVEREKLESSWNGEAFFVANPRHSALKCLALVARHHGLECSSDRLAHDYSLATEEPSLRRILRMGKDIGLKARHVRLTWKQLGKMDQAFPAMARLTNGNYVIMIGLREVADTNGKPSQQIAIFDPSINRKHFVFHSREQFESVWKGEAILTKKTFSMLDSKQPFSLKWFIPEIFKQRTAFIDVAVAALFIHLIALVVPLFFQIVIDKVLVNSALETLKVLTVGICICLLYTSPSPRDRQKSRMPSSA